MDVPALLVGEGNFMRLLLHIIASFAIGLIFIGDFVLRICSLITTLLSLLLSPLVKVKKHLFIHAKKSISLPRHFLATFKKNVSTTKKKKEKILFPLPRPAFSFPFSKKALLITGGSMFLLLIMLIPLFFFLFLQDLPHPDQLTTREIPQTTKIFDRNGTLLYEIYAAQNRTLVPLSDIPLHLQHATLAIEDKNFYRHVGFDPQAIIRALKENSSGEIVQGGSTITQQLIKSSMLTPEQTVERKIREIVLAFWAERLYSKDQILEMYFNQIPYGGTAWGVEAASEVYFNKNVRELTLPESAFLAGITAAPTAYSPYGSDSTLWKIRQKEVLKSMVELDYITQAEADQAAKAELAFAKPHGAFHAPHFVTYIKDQLVQKYGLAMVEKGGLQVITSLDLSVQEQAEKIVAEEVANATYLNISNGAALVTDPKNGDILAMVGSRDFNDPNGGKYNLTTALRQPGSTVKVITYATALQQGFTAVSILDDSPVTFVNAGSSPYKPVNYDGKYRGKVPLRIALANSLNIPAVKLLNQIGIPSMVAMGQKMGITHWNQDPSQYGLSITLGGSEATMLDMATVNGTLANGGRKVTLNPIVKITTSQGEILEHKTFSQGVRVLDPGVAFIISDILADNNARSLAFGSSSPLTIPGQRVSVKTGTSDNKRDNWTIGYTDDFVVTVWVGNNDNSPMSESLASGISGAAPIWNRLMTTLVAIEPAANLSVPQSVVKLPCLGREEYFLRENISGCRFSFNQQGTENNGLSL